MAVAVLFGLVPSTMAVAQVSDTDVNLGKLKFLSCNSLINDPIASSKELQEWARTTILENTKSIASHGAPKPIELRETYRIGGACLEKTKIFLGPGAMVVQGEICNKDLNEFMAALSSIGIQLSSGSVFKGLPNKVADRVVASAKGDARRLYTSYIITEGGVDFEKMEPRETKNRHAFFCER